MIMAAPIITIAVSNKVGTFKYKPGEVCIEVRSIPPPITIVVHCLIIFVHFFLLEENKE